MRSNNEFEAGDVSSSISDFGSMKVQEKKSLVSKLNKGSDDCTMPIDVQTGAQSRRLCMEPTDGWQADVVARRYQWYTAWRFAMVGKRKLKPRQHETTPAKRENSGLLRSLCCMLKRGGLSAFSFFVIS